MGSSTVISINTMVRVGPWTIERVDRDENWTNCERCDERIKEIWVCTVDEQFVDLAKLDGKRTWRIGSTCGPTLIDVSNQHWKDGTRGIRAKVRLVTRVITLLEAARAKNHRLPEFIEPRLALLLAGTIDERAQKHLGLVMTTQGRWLNLWK
jgi:hypothetical protein